MTSSTIDAVIILASIFEEKGRVYAYQQKGAGNVNLYTRLQISSSNPLERELLKKTFGGSTSKQMPHIWTISGPDSERFAQAILPYCNQHKKKQLSLYLTIREHIDKHKRGKGSTIDEKELAAREWMVRQMEYLKDLEKRNQQK